MGVEMMIEKLEVEMPQQQNFFVDDHLPVVVTADLRSLVRSLLL